MANVLYGFTNLQGLFATRVEQTNVRQVTDAIDATIAEHNRQMDALLGLFATATSEYKVRYQTPANARLQPLDESGRARPIRQAGYYDVAFPLQDAGIATGVTYKASQKMTVGEVNNQMATLLTADRRWMRDHILAALFANTSWTFTDDEHGSLTIKGLANSDTDTYLIQAGADGGATDTHYLAQAGAIADVTDPFDTIYAELTEHPENSGDVVCLVPTANKAAVEGLAAFHPITDPNLSMGASAVTVTGTLGVQLPGRLLGYHEAKVWLVEWKSLPDNYLVAMTTQGPRALAMRQDATPALQGFTRVAERNDHPWYEAQYLRIAGFGAWNRVGALVYRVGNGSYAVPTNFTSPMA
jgi:hypothetical protein